MTAHHEIGELHQKAEEFRARLREVKAGIAPKEWGFYPYDTLGSFFQLSHLLTGEGRNLLRLAEGRPMADVGAADGDLSFFLETLGYTMEIVDHAPTNFNTLRGARAVKEALGSKVTISDVDLDSQFTLPRDDYGLVFFLGILYHLKNPFFALESLSRASRHCVVSTRVAKFASDVSRPASSTLETVLELARDRLPPKAKSALTQKRIEQMPVAYLVDDYECNNDPTNFWIFSVEGLKRLFKRTGWEIIDFATSGDTERSDPASQKGDERAWVFARSLRKV